MRRVLAVDDSASMRDIVLLTMKMAGFNATLAKDGAEALQIAQKEQFDLVLTDVHMPNMGGIELVRALRALPAYRTIPIVALTTEKDIAHRHEGRTAGVTGWIIKPFLPDKLISTLQHLLK